MSEIHFIGDIHFGLERVSHTTPVGRVRFRKAIQDLAHFLAIHSGARVQLGDLFDRPRNTDETFHISYEFARRMDMVLAGNHDIVNREGAETSFTYLASILEGRLVKTIYDEPDAETLDYDKVRVVGVPYQPTQEAFETALKKARSYALRNFSNVLCLHAHYDWDLANDNPLICNLTPIMADYLLDRFDFIFLGHEHVPRKLHQGRVIVAGSIMPLNFGEISDRFLWTLGSNGVTQKVIWDATMNYISLDWEEALTAQLEGVQMVRITGQPSASGLAEVYKTVHRWWSDLNSLLMVKVDTQEIETKTNLSKFKNIEIRPLADSMSEILAGTDLLELWEDIYHTYQNIKKS